jgi:CelD/BcsL family acetyltransferase involved in cellulose biosynthesis
MKATLLDTACLGDADWRAFDALYEMAAQMSHPMLHPDYARLVSRVRPDTRVIAIEAGTELVGFWPIHLRPGRWARPVGGPFCDMHGPVLKPGISLDLHQLLSEVKLRGMTLTGLAGLADCRAKGLAPDTVHLTRLDQGWDAFLAAQTHAHARFFKKHWRLARKLHRDHASVEFVFDDQSPNSLQHLLELKSRQFRATGRHDVLASQWSRAFIDLLRAGDRDRLFARLSSLYVDGAFAGGELNLQSGAYLHGWMVGFDRRYADYSPGLHLAGRILKAMTEQGLTVYDAGVGHAHYKKYFSNAATTVWGGTLPSSQPGLSLSGLASSAYRTVERRAPTAPKAILGKIRRRSDQILASELSLSERVKGFVKAAGR